MKELDPHVQSILKWQESMVLMNEVSFFELMRSYLGQILTPYNKKKLIEELSAFLKSSPHREKMLLMLDNEDKEILSAINFIEDCTADKLSLFFASEFSRKELYEKLSNLEERLFVFSHVDERTGKKVLSITPYITDLLKDVLKLSYILPKARIAAASESENENKAKNIITQELLASLLSFVHENPDLFKQDGTFKKKTVESLEEIFPSVSMEFLHNILTALYNLAVLKKDSKTEKFAVDYDKAKRFAELTPKFQNAFFCVSLCSYFSRSSLQENTQLYLDTLSMIPSEGFTLASIMKVAFLIKEKRNIQSVIDRSSSGRFSRMVFSHEKEEGEGQNNDEAESAELRRIFEKAIEMQFLVKKGEDTDGNAVYAAAQTAESVKADKVLSVDSSFIVTLMPGLTLASLLPLTRALDIRHFDTASTFELTRKSAMACFDSGMDADSLFDLLSGVALYLLPQNIRVSIDEWFTAYNSATLYQGFVLQVSEEKERLIEQNFRLREHIKKKLAAGVFLMDFSSSDDASNILRRNSFEFVGKTDAEKKGQFILPYPLLHENEMVFSLEDEGNSEDERVAEREEYFQKLRNIVENQRLEKDVRNELLSRIDRRMIMDEKQLSAGAVRVEKLEAGSMDYFGKVHVIEHSIETKAMLEIQLSGETVSGTPVQLDKKGRGTEAVLTLSVGETEKKYLVSSLLHVKLIRGAIFPLE